MIHEGSRVGGVRGDGFRPGIRMLLHSMLDHLRKRQLAYYYTDNNIFQMNKEHERGRICQCDWVDELCCDTYLPYSNTPVPAVVTVAAVQLLA